MSLSVPARIEDDVEYRGYIWGVSYPIDCAVFDHLNPLELYRLRRVCRSACIAVNDYVASQFTIAPILLRFFNIPDAKQFRYLMAETGLLISGSTAVQFFGCVVYDDSDLDLYVREEYTHQVATWLMAAGYVFDVTQYTAREVRSVQNFISSRLSVQYRPLGDEFADIGPEGYMGASMVLTFNNVEKRKKVQVIAARTCPMQIILGFHSTVVLNVISHSTAYSLYPIPSFVQKRNLVLFNQFARDPTRALLKYELRGFERQGRLTRDESCDPGSSFSPGVRYLGDSRCWTIQLPPLDAPVPASHENFKAHSWISLISLTRACSFNTSVFLSDRLESGYLVSPSVTYSEVLIRLSELKDKHPNTRFLDAFCSTVFR